MASDNDFWREFFDYWKAGNMFSTQQLDLTLSQQDPQNFDNW